MNPQFLKAWESVSDSNAIDCSGRLFATVINMPAQSLMHHMPACCITNALHAPPHASLVHPILCIVGSHTTSAYTCCPCISNKQTMKQHRVACLLPVGWASQPNSLTTQLPPPHACSVHWQQHGINLVAGAAPLPLQVVSGTHLDIEAVFLPPPGYVAGSLVCGVSTASDGSGGCSGVCCGAGSGAAPQCSSSSSGGGISGGSISGGAAAGSNKPGISSWDGGTAAGAAGGAGDVGGPPRVGFVIGSWRPGGRGAAVVSFDWSSRLLQVHSWETGFHLSQTAQQGLTVQVCDSAAKLCTNSYRLAPQGSPQRHHLAGCEAYCIVL